jgi:phosphoglycolate phosphatase
MVGDGARVLVERALTAAAWSDPGHASRAFLEIYDTRLLVPHASVSGREAAIEAARRGARVTMLTNKPLHHTARIVEALGWAPLFDEVVGWRQPLGPQARAARAAAMMTAAGVTAAQTMLVGDSKVDLDTARRAGVRCCLVSFGYGFESVGKAPIEGRDDRQRTSRRSCARIDVFVGAPSGGPTNVRAISGTLEARARSASWLARNHAAPAPPRFACAANRLLAVAAEPSCSSGRRSRSPHSAGVRILVPSAGTLHDAIARADVVQQQIREERHRLAIEQRVAARPGRERRPMAGGAADRGKHLLAIGSGSLDPSRATGRGTS